MGYMTIQLKKIERGEQKKNKEWKKMMDKHHYLGSSGRIGAEIRYLIYKEGKRIGGINFSSPALKCKAREQWIGWNETTRQERLQEVINNARFLIIPGKKTKNLASQVLSQCAKQVPRDWKERYGREPLLMETFVDDRFDGASYKAANWIYVGDTKGRGKRDRKHEQKLSIKSVFVYPLVKKATKN